MLRPIEWKTYVVPLSISYIIMYVVLVLNDPDYPKSPREAIKNMSDTATWMILVSFKELNETINSDMCYVFHHQPL